MTDNSHFICNATFSSIDDNHKRPTLINEFIIQNINSNNNNNNNNIDSESTPLSVCDSKEAFLFAQSLVCICIWCEIIL